MSVQKNKVVRVGFEEGQHAIFKAYQDAVKLDGSQKPPKNDIVVLAMDKGGFAWLKKETARLKKAAVKKLS